MPLIRAAFFIDHSRIERVIFMIHQYKLGDYNIVLDVCSGSVHAVDEVAYDIIPLFESNSREDILRAMEEKLAALETALERSEGDRQKTAAVLRTETELFYELLASVNLPETQKAQLKGQPLLLSI